jgi:hypothetical protein
MVNSMGDLERVEQRVAQIDRIVHVERKYLYDEINLVTGKSSTGAKESRK